jgi:release factor glutamine methyltransferase
MLCINYTLKMSVCLASMITRRLPRRLALLACAHLSSATELPFFRLAPPATASLGAALQSAVAAFATAEVPEAEVSAQHLLARAAGFGSSRNALTTQLDAPLSEPVRSCFEQMCSQRLARQPVQYILGDWDFHELTLQMRAPVLIPRPETEQLVEMVLAAHGDNPALRLLDVGCGSGAIGLALLNKLPQATCVAIDIREAAVALSSENAALVGVGGRYSALHVPEGIAAFTSTEPFDVIVSNPPYIPAPDMPGLAPEVRQNEDHAALCGGTDGADVIRDLLRVAPRLLRAGGPCAIWLEVDPSHPRLLERWLREEGAWEEAFGTQAEAEAMRMVESFEDFGGLERFCRLEWEGQGGCQDAAADGRADGEAPCADCREAAGESNGAIATNGRDTKNSVYVPL